MTAPYNAAPGRVQVPAPVPLKPDICLLTSAEIVEDDSRWEGGYYYDPTLSVNSIRIEPICENLGNYYYNECMPVEVDTFALAASERTSTFNRLNKDLYTRTRQALTAYEFWFIEQQFISNPLGVNMPWLLNPLNTYDGSTTPSAVPEALATIESYISSYAMDALRPMIYVTHHTMVHLVRHQTVSRQGNLWITPVGSIVVPLAGYLWTGQASSALPPLGPDQEYIYATAGVQIRRSDIFTVPGQEEKTAQNPFGYPTSAISRSTNEIAVSTQRIYGVSFTTNVNVPVLYATIDQSIPPI